MPGVLVLHGFTATAREVQPLADHLGLQGFDVECPTLPGHGTTPADLQSTSWRDWYAGAEAALTMLAQRNEGQSLAVCGQSMGGLLALRLAAMRSDVRAVCALATPLWLPKTVQVLVRLLGPWMRFCPKAGPDLSDPLERKQHVGYPVFPLRATQSLIDLMTEVRGRVPKVRVPTFVIHSQNDHTASPNCARYLAQHLANGRLLMLEKSFHILTRDVERVRLQNEVTTFLKEAL